MTDILRAGMNGLKITANFQKHLHIGQKTVSITWRPPVAFDMLIVSVYNANKKERTFHLLHVSAETDKWRVVEDTSGTLHVTIYGVQSGDDQVVSSCQETLNHLDDNEMIPVLHLGNHTPITMSSLIQPYNTQVNIEEMAVEIHQNVQQYGIQQATIQFHCSTTIENPKTYIHILKSGTDREFIRITENQSDVITCPWKLESRCTFHYQIFYVKAASTNILKYMVKSASKCLTFVTHATKSEVAELYNLAEKFRAKRLSNRRTTKTIPVPCLYRNKPTTHETIQSASKTGIIAKYIKDNNGDKSSCINNQINGLFFSASVCKKTKMPPEFSFFGDYRLMIPPEHMLPNLNIYFADFYCQAPKRPHYVTLVLTKPGSVEDLYCQPRLPKLNINANKFLFFDPRIGYRVTKACHIECLYTEDIDLISMRQKEGVIETIIKNVRGRGQSRPEGIPKYEYCEDCNLPKK